MKFILLFLFGTFLSVVNAQDTTRISLLFAGDVMGHDSQIASAYNSESCKYDYQSCFQFVKPYVEMADIAFGNLEVTLAGPPYKGYPQFSSPDELAVTLKNIGFDVLVTANNHSVDRGKKGILRTIKVLDSLNIPHTGTFVDELDRLNNYPLLLNKNGFTIALLNYTYGTNGIPVPAPTIVNPIDTAVIKSDFEIAKKHRPDVIIAFMHWGVEYESLPRKSQKELTEFCFKYGADLVIGAHPHVLQPMEWRKDKNDFVVYSLGNFVSGQRKRYTDGGAMTYLELKKVRHREDSIVTYIDSAAYLLQWVYRTADSNKDYFILPLPSFENDSSAFIKDEASRQALKTFVKDSRDLLDKHNIAVREIRTIPADTLVRYKVHVIVARNDSLEAEPFVADPIDTFYGLEMVNNEPENLEFILGPFADPRQAEKVCQLLILAGRNANVRKYVNGLPITADP